MARVEVIGHQISRFCLREVEEHICVVDFIRRRLDLHRSKKGVTTCLRDQRHGGEIVAMVLWELCEAMGSRSMGKQWHYGGFVLCV